MTVAEHRERVGKEFQQAQEQAQRFGQQATQWAQRVLYLQGQLDLLKEMAGEGMTPVTDVPAAAAAQFELSRAERRRQEKANGKTRAVSPPA